MRQGPNEPLACEFPQEFASKLMGYISGRKGIIRMKHQLNNLCPSSHDTATNNTPKIEFCHLRAKQSTPFCKRVLSSIWYLKQFDCSTYKTGHTNHPRCHPREGSFGKLNLLAKFDREELNPGQCVLFSHQKSFKNLYAQYSTALFSHQTHDGVSELWCSEFV